MKIIFTIPGYPKSLRMQISKKIMLLLRSTKRFCSFHLNQIEMTYFSHMKRAIVIGLKMIVGGALCVIHGFLPFIFVETASKVSLEIVKKTK